MAINKPDRLFTLKTGNILTTLGVVSLLTDNRIDYSIRPDVMANEGNSCTCQSCTKMLLTTTDAGIKVLEEKAGEMIPEDMYVHTDSEGRIPQDRVNAPSTTTRQ